jgi:hypothetical protein
MRTPYGKECRFFYADYFRGHETQACRLIERNPNSDPWTVSLCQTCPVPDILMANQNPNLRLRAHVAKGLLGLTKRVEVEAICIKHGVELKNPKLGCDQCRAEMMPQKLMREP